MNSKTSTESWGIEDPSSRKKNHQVHVEVVEDLGRIGPKITKKNTNWRSALHPEFCHYLSTINRYNDLEFAYRSGDNTIFLFVKDVSEAIYDEGKKLW